MGNKWKISAWVEYESRATAIEVFEDLVKRLKTSNYVKGGGGNSAAQHFVSGPSEKLTDDEITRLRALIS